MTAYETLLLTRPEPGLLAVTMNRPQAANALNTQMGHDLHAVFFALVLDPGDTRCVILTGAGDKAFCAGGDLKERKGMTDEAWRKQHAVFEQAVYAMMDCPVPLIAAVNGAAYGGGCEFALACDFAYAADTARFAFPETSLGIIPGAGGTQTLPRAVGTRKAKEMILSGKAIDAAEALEMGILNKVVPAAGLMDAVLEIARRIAANGPVAVRQAKRAIGMGAETELKTGLAIEIEAYNRAAMSEDRCEGILAKNEKRAPNFKGR